MAAFVLSGAWTALLFKDLSALGRVRIALWSGFAQVILLLIVLNFFSPLQSAATLWLLTILAASSTTAWLARRGWRLADRRKVTTPRRGSWIAIPIALIGMSVLLIAHAFAGPLDNWDSGLYQVNAIQYSANYQVIPGLANLHERFGTNTTSSLVSALLAATPWGIEAFRLLVGLFVFLFSFDLVLRLLDRTTRGNSPGLLLMLLAASAFLPFSLANTAAWITGPTPDTISMLLVVIAAAYLLDAFWSRNLVWATVAGLLAVVAATVRTQLWVFAVLVVLVLAIHFWRSENRLRRWTSDRAFVIFGGLLTLLLGLGMAIRDYLLSGWLLFPATAFPMPVDWRVPDPAASREWIMSWAREPGASPEDVLNSWDWLWRWVGRTASDWSVLFMFGSILASLLIWLFLRNDRRLSATQPGVSQPSQGSTRVGVKGLTLLLVPSFAALAVWFFAAPDPRFAWGLLLSVGLIPLALALSLVSTRFTLIPRSGVVLVLTAGFMSLVVAGPVASQMVLVKGYVSEGFELREYSFGPVTIKANVNPVETPAIAEFQLDDGNVILTPTQDDRCQLTFPACSPYPDPTMQFRGDSVQDGFRSPRTTNN